MSITTVTAIIKDCCEAEPSDPDHPDTICISVSDLEIIVARNLEVVILSDDPLPHNAALSARAVTQCTPAQDAERYQYIKTIARKDTGWPDYEGYRHWFAIYDPEKIGLDSIIDAAIKGKK